MKKLTLAAMLVFAIQAPMPALAGPPAADPAAPVNVLLAGGEADNVISIRLSPDGRAYVIDSIVPLETGGTVCSNPPDLPTELICQASAVASVEVNADDGNDRIAIGRSVTIPVVVRGGPGNDRVIAGGGPDKLFGGSGNDYLHGRGGNDSIFGGTGLDKLFGGSGNDMLRGGLGKDFLLPGSGLDSVRQ